jgi:hypothetical protein
MEFAVSIPILITFIWYLYDISKMARMREKMKFVGYEMAGILQNISQNRANKRISKDDIRHAVAGAYLSLYLGKTMYAVSGGFAPLGHTSSGNLYCVKGEKDGNASVIWCVRWHSAYNTPSPATISVVGRDSRSIVKLGSDVKSSSIYPDLRIEEGEMKILLEVTLHYSQAPGYGFADGRDGADVPPKTAFGFFVLNPPKNGQSVYFNTVVIFTPKPGLFSETAP